MLCELNGEPGVLLHIGGGWAAVTVTVDEGLVTAVCIVVNPAKLERLVGEMIPVGSTGHEPPA